MGIVKVLKPSPSLRPSPEHNAWHVIPIKIKADSSAVSDNGTLSLYVANKAVAAFNGSAWKAFYEENSKA